MKDADLILTNGIVVTGEVRACGCRTSPCKV